MTATIPRGRGIEFLNIKFLPEKMPGKYIGNLVLIGIEDNFLCTVVQLLIQIITPDFKKERPYWLIRA